MRMGVVRGCWRGFVVVWVTEHGSEIGRKLTELSFFDWGCWIRCVDPLIGAARVGCVDLNRLLGNDLGATLFDIEFRIFRRRTERDLRRLGVRAERRSAVAVFPISSGAMRLRPTGQRDIV